MSVVCPKNYGSCGVDIVYDPDRLFVLMPFSESIAPQSLFFDVLQPLPGWNVHRADSDLSKPEIWCKICANIQSSRAVIADLSGSNPNVFLELGLTWGLGRPFILLTQDHSTLPFDTKSFQVIKYERTLSNSATIKDVRKIQDQIARALKALPEGDKLVHSSDYVISDFTNMIEQTKERTAGLWRRVDGIWRIEIDNTLDELVGLEFEQSKPPYKIMVSLLRSYPECKTTTQVATDTGLSQGMVSLVISGKRYDFADYFIRCRKGFRLSDKGIYYLIEEERLHNVLASQFNPNQD